MFTNYFQERNTEVSSVDVYSSSISMVSFEHSSQKSYIIKLYTRVQVWDVSCD